MAATSTVLAPTLSRIGGERTAPSFLSRFSRNRVALAGAILLLALCALSLIAPELTVDPRAQDVRARLQGPSWEHWFGTDEVGRDIFSRTVNGGRISLVSGVIAVLVGLGLGTAVGLLAGYFEGRIGLALMAGIDLLLALPAILLAITIAARLGPGLTSAMLAAGFVGLPNYARLARGSALTVKRREYIDAARAMGASNGRIMVRHILPNIVSPLIVQATIGIGSAILLVSALGFLGMGAQPPQPEWGRMLADAQRYILTEPYMGVFPGAAIALTVLGFNLVGDGLRDAVDPTARR
jgi:peptide/nickel transport system permease protein